MRPCPCARRGFVAEGLLQGTRTYAQPTTTLAGRCRGSTLAVRHPNGEIGSTAWIFAETFTGLATSSAGGVGLLEQTIPNASGL